MSDDGASNFLSNDIKMSKLRENGQKSFSHRTIELSQVYET